MENQNPPPFPFDGFDVPFDIGDEFAPNAGIPSTPAVANEEHRALENVQRKLQELQGQIAAILELVARELGGAVRSSGLPRSLFPRPESSPAPMQKLRPMDPLSSTLTRNEDADGRVLEGVFDGQHMVGPDGKQYSVPANYASKSKLVEGDILKLRITERGAFVYKQIGPIARDRRVGVLEHDEVTGDYVVVVPDRDDDRSEFVRAVVQRDNLPSGDCKRYRVLRASITYYRGAPGDEVVLLVPKDAPSTWAAVDNLIKR